MERWRWRRIGGWVGLGVLGLFLWTCMSWARGDAGPSFGGLVPLIGPVIGFSIIAKMSKPQIRPLTESEGVEKRWREALDAAGFDKIRLAYGVAGDVATFPRVMTTGLRFIVPKRVAEEYSEDALLWSLKTETTGSMASSRTGVPALLAVLLLGLVLTASGQRLKLPDVWLLLPVGFIVLGVVTIFYVAFLQQVATDRRLTVTEADRRAAKEALSYPYFAQRDKRLFDKWLFFSGELRGRARRLGIELERGYRADSSGE